MEGLIPNSAYLKKLRKQLRKLTADSLSLGDIFAEEAVHMNWTDEASRLKALYLSIREQMDRARRLENAVSYGHSRVSLVMKLGEIAVGGAIGMLSRNKEAQAISYGLLNDPGGEHRPYGRVRICVGPKGIPDDVQVVSISGLASESKREEAEVIDELQRHGCLLFSEKVFSLLIDKMACAVQEGRLHLPVSIEKLMELPPQTSIRLIPKR